MPKSVKKLSSIEAASGGETITVLQSRISLSDCTLFWVPNVTNGKKPEV
jgi:hypothetical protein